MIQRVEYLKCLENWREQQLVKIVKGVRGCGKTTLFAMYIDWLKQSGVEDGQIIFINMEDPASKSLFNYQGLNGYIKKRLCVNKCTYIFIDEIQKCTNFEKAIEGFILKKQVDLYAASSDACIVSNLPHVEIRMLTLSFAEYLIFTKYRNDRPKIPGRTEIPDASASPDGDNPAKIPAHSKSDRRLPRQREQIEKYLRREAFNNYVSFGGFPFAAVLNCDTSLICQCVEGIYNTVLIKSAARQSNINNIPLLECIAELMSHSTGRLFSSKKTSTAISAKWRKISVNTVEAYIGALQSAFLFYYAERYDIKTGKRLKTLGKYYIADTGIRNMLLEPDAPELEGHLENIVFLELLRRGFQVYIGKNGSDEINFVAFSDNDGSRKTAYFQVAASVRDGAVLAEKLSPLEQIQDDNSKYILSLDETPFRATHNGITRKNLIDWLLDS
ncbi:MAG: ATP-binding protein [Treponema sp.]|nr:ATP-binding protein [Treponema sp.]